MSTAALTSFARLVACVTAAQAVSITTLHAPGLTGLMEPPSKITLKVEEEDEKLATRQRWAIMFTPNCPRASRPTRVCAREALPGPARGASAPSPCRTNLKQAAGPKHLA